MFPECSNSQYSYTSNKHIESLSHAQKRFRSIISSPFYCNCFLKDIYVKTKKIERSLKSDVA